MKCLKKCCISTAVGGTDDDDDMLWNGSEEVGDVRSECGENEGGEHDTDWYR